MSAAPTVILMRPEADEESRREAIKLLDAETLRWMRRQARCAAPSPDSFAEMRAVTGETASPLRMTGYQRIREIMSRATIKQGYGV